MLLNMCAQALYIFETPFISPTLTYSIYGMQYLQFTDAVSI